MQASFVLLCPKTIRNVTHNNDCIVGRMKSLGDRMSTMMLSDTFKIYHKLKVWKPCALDCKMFFNIFRNIKMHLCIFFNSFLFRIYF